MAAQILASKMIARGYRLSSPLFHCSHRRLSALNQLATAPQQRKKCFMFPGMGSQYPGMCRDLCNDFPYIRTFLEECNELLGFSITDIMWNSDAKELEQASFAGTSIVIHSMCIWNILQREYEIETVLTDDNSSVIGHSTGEYSALRAANVFGTFKDALNMTYFYAKCMQRCSSTEQAMYAVIAEDIDIALLESTVSQHNVDIANINTSNQIIISGLKTNIDAEVAAFNTDNDVNYLATGGAYRLSDIAFQMEPDIAFHYDFDDDCDELTETHLDIPCLDFDCDELHIPCLDFDLDGAPEMVTHDDCDELNETHLHIRIIWTLIAVACCIITFINDYCVHDGVGYDMHTLIDTEIDHECGLLYQNQELIANEFTDYCELRTALSWDMSREILQEAMHCARGGDVHGDTLWQGDACGYTLWQEFTCFASFESYVQQPILRGEHEDEDLHSFRDDLQPVNGSSWFGDG
eukprot:803205_1